MPLENAVASGAITLDDLFDENYVEIAGSNPALSRDRIIDTGGEVSPLSKSRDWQD